MSTSVANRKGPSASDGRPVSYRIYNLLLRAYPTEFRDDFGPYMACTGSGGNQKTEPRRKLIKPMQSLRILRRGQISLSTQY